MEHDREFTMRIQKLMPKFVAKPIPPLYGQEGVEDPVVHVKLFTPYSSWTWFITEYDPVEKRAFGFAYNSADPGNAELGYMAIDEMEELRTKHGLQAVERDISFCKMPLSEAKRQECTSSSRPDAT